MTKTLIITEPGDTHGHAVQWALRNLGHRSQLWIPEQLECLPITVRLDAADVTTKLQAPDGPIDLNSVAAVWLRRFSLPRFPDWMATGDQIVAKRETENFLRGIAFVLGEGVQWFNAPLMQRMA